MEADVLLSINRYRLHFLLQFLLIDVHPAKNNVIGFSLEGVVNIFQHYNSI